jgi:hypothetical protein
MMQVSPPPPKSVLSPPEELESSSKGGFGTDSSDWRQVPLEGRFGGGLQKLSLAGEQSGKVDSRGSL